MSAHPYVSEWSESHLPEWRYTDLAKAIQPRLHQRYSPNQRPYRSSNQRSRAMTDHPYHPIDTIDTLRAQLAEAQRDAERLDWIIEHRAYVVSDPDCCDGYWLNYARPDGTMWTQATEHETPRAAIDAAKGEPS